MLDSGTQNAIERFSVKGAGTVDLGEWKIGAHVSCLAMLLWGSSKVCPFTRSDKKVKCSQHVSGANSDSVLGSKRH